MIGSLNCTESRGEVVKQDDALVFANALVTAFITVGGITGNLLIIIVFFKKKSLRSVNNVFLVQLAGIDFIKATLVLIPKVYTQLSKTCAIPAAYCQVSGFVSTISFIHSALLLAAIAVVRYFKMVQSSHFDVIFSQRRLIAYCLFLAVQTAVFGFVPIFGGGKYIYSPYHGVCFTDWSSKNRGFRIVFYVYTIGICYTAILFCYTMIYLKLRAHNIATMASFDSSKGRGELQEKCESNPPKGTKGIYRARCGVENAEISPNSPSGVGSSSSSSSSNKSNRELDDVSLQDKAIGEVALEDAVDNVLDLPVSREKQSIGTIKSGGQSEPDNATKPGKFSCYVNTAVKKMKSKKKGSEKDNRSSRLYLNELKVTKIMFLIVIAYTVCWVPAFVINVYMFATLKEGVKGNSEHVSPNMLYLIITLVDVKVFINPLIYGILNFQFRKEIKSLLRKLCDF